MQGKEALNTGDEPSWKERSVRFPPNLVNATTVWSSGPSSGHTYTKEMKAVVQKLCSN